jgi:hypothetical protein
MIVGYGIAAWPFLAAKYELQERRRALTALMIGVAAILAALLISGAHAPRRSRGQATRDPDR